jgi:hypothetical protein
MAVTLVNLESSDVKSRFSTLAQKNNDGNYVVAGSDSPLITADVNHVRLHEGRAYYVYKTHKDTARLAVGANIDIAIAFPAGVEAHASVDYQAGGETEIYVYESPTTSGGTSMTLYRRNRVINTASQGVAVLNPTVSAVGTEFYSELITSAEGQGNRSGAGGRSLSFEFILKPLTTYLFRLTNVNGSSQMAELRIDWYE